MLNPIFALIHRKYFILEMYMLWIVCVGRSHISYKPIL